MNTTIQQRINICANESYVNRVKQSLLEHGKSDNPQMISAKLLFARDLSGQPTDDEITVFVAALP